MNPSPEKRKKPYVTVMSGIGNGKTEITTLIKDRRNFAPIYEPVETNPYLNRFYTEDEGMKTWASLLQIRFLVDRLILEAFEIPTLLNSPEYEGVIEDSQRKQDNSYAWLHHKNGNIGGDEWDLYKTINRLGKKVGQIPDLIVHPKASMPVKVERIKKIRARDSEQNVTEEYLSLVDQAVLFGIGELVKDGAALFEYDTDNRNLVNNEADIQHFLETFDAQLVKVGFPQFENYQPKK